MEICFVNNAISRRIRQRKQSEQRMAFGGCSCPMRTSVTNSLGDRQFAGQFSKLALTRQVYNIGAEWSSRFSFFRQNSGAQNQNYTANLLRIYRS